MIIQFDKSIYSEIAVQKGVKDFSSVADIDYVSTDDYCKCVIRRSDYSLETTADELSNYILNLTVMSDVPI